jgi:hypothetical protein
MELGPLHAACRASATRAGDSPPRADLPHGSAERKRSRRTDKSGRSMFYKSFVLCMLRIISRKVLAIMLGINGLLEINGFVFWLCLGLFLETAFVFNRNWLCSVKQSIVSRDGSPPTREGWQRRGIRLSVRRGRLESISKAHGDENLSPWLPPKSPAVDSKGLLGFVPLFRSILGNNIAG